MAEDTDPDKELVIDLDPAGDETDTPEIDKPQVIEADTTGLSEQIEALKLAQQKETERADEAERIAAEAVQYAQQREGQAYQEYQRANQERQARTASEGEMVQSALQAAQAEQAAAKQAHKMAGEAGDLDAQADAVARIGRAAGQIHNIEMQAASLAQEQQAEAYYARQAQTRAQQQPQHQTNQRQLSPDERLAQMKSSPNLYPQEKEWLEKNPELITNPVLNKELDAVYKGTVRLGLPRGTPEYFEHISNAMGLKSERQPSMASRVSAPVSRTSSPGSAPREVKLNERDIEIANGMGFKSKADLQAYARNKVARSNTKVDPFTGKVQ